MKQKIIKQTVFFLCIGLLLFPLFQNVTEVVAIPELKGVFVAVEKPTFSANEWFAGDFQEKFDKYSKSILSIRSFLIRMHNQLNFSLFNETNSDNVFVGKDNYLFNKDILGSYLGEGVLSEEVVTNEFKKLKFVQDTLAKLNKHIVFIITPSKPSHCIEYVPERYLSEKKRNNYDVFSKVLKGSGVNYIDFSAYFEKLKKESLYLLFSPMGLHWSFYGATVASDSLVHYMEAKAQTKFATYEWGDVVLEHAKGEDADVEDILNLSYTINAAEMAYPKLIINSRHNDSLRVISISDSFYGSLYYSCMSKVLPPSNEYWFYGRQIFSDKFDFSARSYFSQIDFAQKVKETDFIILLQNEANLYSMGFGFIDRLYKMFTNDKSPIAFDVAYYKYVDQMAAKIRFDSNRLMPIQTLAQEKKLPLDSLIKAQAIVDLEREIWNGTVKIEVK